MCSVNLKRCIDELESPGDYCFLSNGKVMLNCPFCKPGIDIHIRNFSPTMMVLPHAVLQRNPLTISPSVVGPDNIQKDTQHIFNKCGHHFFIKNGEAINV